MSWLAQSKFHTGLLQPDVGVGTAWFCTCHWIKSSLFWFSYFQVQGCKKQSVCCHHTGGKVRLRQDPSWRSGPGTVSPASLFFFRFSRLHGNKGGRFATFGGKMIDPVVVKDSFVRGSPFSHKRCQKNCTGKPNVGRFASQPSKTS